MIPALTKTSLTRLIGVHPHLVSLVHRTVEISDLAFQVTEGVRSLERQRALVAAGASQTMRSRHLKAPNGLGHAVDLVVFVDGTISWKEVYYHRLADLVKQASASMGIPVEWGGDFRNFFDGPHFQLPWDRYPGIASIHDPAPEQPSDDDRRTLSAGARGALVIELQTLLNAAGAGLRADGDFGGRTLAAVKAFQTRAGLTADGIVGPKTWAALATKHITAPKG